MQTYNNNNDNNNKYYWSKGEFKEGGSNKQYGVEARYDKDWRMPKRRSNWKVTSGRDKRDVKREIQLQWVSVDCNCKEFYC